MPFGSFEISTELRLNTMGSYRSVFGHGVREFGIFLSRPFDGFWHRNHPKNLKYSLLDSTDQLAMARHPFFSRYTQHFNRRLALSVTLIAVSQFNYGFDNQAFATTQAMEEFNRQFGQCDSVTDKCDIPSHLLSLLNSLPYIGFAVGK